MKKLILLSIILITISNCVKVNTPGGIVIWGSEETSSVNLPFKNFNEIIVSDKFHVKIKQGENYSVKIKSNANMKDFLAVEKKYTVLLVKMKPNHFYKDAILEVEITMPDLVYLDVNGMSNATFENFSNLGEMKIEVSEASKINGQLKINRLDLIGKNGGDVELSGSTSFLKLEGMLSANFGLTKFKAGKANIYLSINSKGEFNITDRFVAELRGGSTMRYTGGGTEEKVVKDKSSRIVKQ